MEKKISAAHGFVERKVTASDVAELAGVSKWTVSRAFTPGASISPKAQEKVLKAAKELGYSPNLLARGLKTRKSNMIGLVVDEMDNPNLLKVLNEVTRQLQMKGSLSVILNITDRNYGQALSLADQFQVDGLIFLGTVLTDELIKLTKVVRHIPLVVLYRNSDNPDIQVVSTDGYLAGQEIADLFIQKGYRRIGYMTGPSTQSTQLKRLEGFRAQLESAGIDVCVVLEAGHYNRKAGQDTLCTYLREVTGAQRIEALFCENDILAIGAIDALRSSDAAPDIAIVGFDNIDEAAAPTYELTTYQQPLELLVPEAIRRLTDPGRNEQKFLAPGSLVMRRSHIKPSQRS